jgi:hypothetical protein
LTALGLFAHFLVNTQADVGHGPLAYVWHKCTRRYLWGAALEVDLPFVAIFHTIHSAVPCRDLHIALPLPYIARSTPRSQPFYRAKPLRSGCANHPTQKLRARPATHASARSILLALGGCPSKQDLSDQIDEKSCGALGRAEVPHNLQ